MNDNIFALIMQVITAAREGRYMHGNGRYFHIIDNGQKVVIDVQDGTKTPCPNYVGTPMVDMGTVNSLTSFLMLQDSNMQDREFSYDQAKNLVKEAVNSNRLLYTNGAQWVIVHTDGKSVISVSLGVMGKTAPVVNYNAHASWKYMENNGSYRTTVSESTKKYMNF